MSPSVRLLRPGDEEAVAAYLKPRADSSLFLLGNLESAGLADTGAVYSGTWTAAFDGGEIVALAAHCWNGVLLLQAAEPETVARAALAASGRPLAGLSGPRAQVEAARDALGLADAPAAMDHEAELFALALDELAVPRPLADGVLACAPPLPGDLPLLVDWRVAYAVESLGATPGAALTTACRAEVERLVAEGNAFVLRERGVPVAFSGFNARVREIVQVGGVFTPAGLRGHGYARAVVAGSLLEARAGDVRRAVLFTERSNEPARRAYLALGFRVVGDYGMVLLASPLDRVR